LLHESGSSSVLDAMYFCVWFNTSVNGLSWWGQNAAKSS
jgi:hypothetical protein